MIVLFISLKKFVSILKKAPLESWCNRMSDFWGFAS